MTQFVFQRARGMALWSLLFAAMTLIACGDEPTDYDPPVAEIEAEPTSGIAPVEVSFSAAVTAGTGDYSYTWDFDDGERSAEAEPTYVFDEGGTYNVTLVVTDLTSGLQSEPAELEIDITPDEMPVAAPSASPSTGIAPFTVSFSGMATGGNEPLSYAWDFGDGSQPVDGQNPSHEYTTPGTYTASLTVTDTDGDENTGTVQVEVIENGVPVADIAASTQQGIAPLSVQFDPQVQGGDAPLTYAWDFGTGDSSDTRAPSYTFEDPGTYTVTVEVTDDNGDVATDTIDIEVTDDSVPQVTASATPETGLAPLEVQFDAEGTGGDGELAYRWEFGDGTNSQIADPVHTYQGSGQFTATVTVTDENGDTATASVQIDVGDDQTPSASASASPRTGLAPLDVEFFGNASGGEQPLSFAWSFGDGANSTMQNPTHTYQSPGAYTASLVVTDATGDSANSTVEIIVEDNATPQVSVNASQTTGIAPTSVEFDSTVSSGDAPFTYQWDFGDNSQSTEASPEHTYQSAGSYDATLTVTDANGDTATDTVTIDVASNEVPAVSVSADTDTGTAPLTVNFTASSTGGNAPLNYTWYFGDGSAPTSGDTVTHTYQNSGVFDATVVVTDANGDTAQDSVTINVTPDAPDLAVQSFTAQHNNGFVDWEATLINQGTQAVTQDFTVHFYEDLDQAPTLSTLSDDTDSVFSYIEPGETVVVSGSEFIGDLGVYDAWLYVDRARDNPDTDRSNNIAGPVTYRVDDSRINEVFYDSVGTDTNTFIELYGTPGLDVSGFVLEAVNGSDGSVYSTITLPAGTTFPSDGYLVIGESGVANVDIVDSAADLQNGPDSLVLKDDLGQEIDAVGYGDFTGISANFMGEGSAAFDAPEGYSVGRGLDSADTGDNASDFYLWANPSPGAENRVMLSNAADTCSDAYQISNGFSANFQVAGDLADATNDYTTYNSASMCGSSTATTLGGRDQVFSFVVPSGMVADLTVDLDDNAGADLDAVLTADPCSSLDTGWVGCNAFGQDTFTGLTAGTYYIVVYEDSSTASSATELPYLYNVTLEFN